MTIKTVYPPNISQAPSPSLWFGMIRAWLLVSLTLLVCGGDFGWWQAWAYIVLIFIASIGGHFLAEKRNPGIMVERSGLGIAHNTKSWDKILSKLMAISVTFPLLIVAGLDHRNGWTPLFPTWLNILGLVLTALGYAFVVLALMENRFCSTTVYIQTHREHSVCNSGPYRLVRHPGYAGNIVALPGIVLALGSVWVLIPVVIAMIIIVIRTELEDRTLQEELKGYKDYLQQVRYRLIPGIF
jgi:protein-S-isoprenylcysteine O-methyltransferase Ste14